MYSYRHPHMAEQKQDDQLEHTYSSYVRIRDVALKTCLRWWMIGKSGERGSGISVLAARHDDDDDELSIYSNGETKQIRNNKRQARCKSWTHTPLSFLRERIVDEFKRLHLGSRLTKGFYQPKTMDPVIECCIKIYWIPLNDPKIHGKWLEEEEIQQRVKTIQIKTL